MDWVFCFVALSANSWNVYVSFKPLFSLLDAARIENEKMTLARKVCKKALLLGFTV